MKIENENFLLEYIKSVISDLKEPVKSTKHYDFKCYMVILKLEMIKIYNKEERKHEEKDSSNETTT